jgi:hypothetical protein
MDRSWFGSHGARFATQIVTVIALAVVVLVGVATTATADVTRLYYQEVAKDGRIYVFNSPEAYKKFEATGQMGSNITLVGAGPNGETVIAENDTALDLFTFKHNLPAIDRPAADPPAHQAAALPSVKVGGLAFISYQNGQSNGKDYSQTTIKRAYVDTQAKILPYLSARATFDITQDSTGDWKPRFKYAYGKFDLGTAGFLDKNYIEFGLDHMPWLDFEEHINNFRLQDPMFMERNGLFNSADVGLLVGGNFGEDMPSDYKKHVSGAYAGRYGSYQIGVYNGAGYHGAEANTNKALEGRITVRPVPDVIPGLQISYFGVHGKGNTAAEPDWNLNAGMVSYESEYAVVTGQYVDSKGEQDGKAVDASGKSLKRKGWSGFVEAKVDPNWSIIARYDDFDPNANASNDQTKRTIVGVAYLFNRSNLILLDYEQAKYDQAGKPKDKRTQLTLQVSF